MPTRRAGTVEDEDEEKEDVVKGVVDIVVVEGVQRGKIFKQSSAKNFDDRSECLSKY
jgi:hypothetical protein